MVVVSKRKHAHIKLVVLMSSPSYRFQIVNNRCKKESTEELSLSIEIVSSELRVFTIRLSMHKTASNKVANSQTTEKTQTTTAKSSANSIQRRGNGRNSNTHCVPRNSSLSTTSAIDKDNDSSLVRSPTDVSDDEQIRSSTEGQKVPRRVSAVHESATKLSPIEYKCKLCYKVKFFLNQTPFICNRQPHFKRKHFYAQSISLQINDVVPD
jgi:hypothetical protein